MRLLNSLIENDPNFRLGYKSAIDDLKIIFEHAKIFNPNMDIIDLVDDWEKITAVAQRKIFGGTEN